MTEKMKNNIFKNKRNTSHVISDKSQQKADLVKNSEQSQRPVAQKQ